jgi:nucleoside-diphosphate-sugar epimerase
MYAGNVAFVMSALLAPGGTSYETFFASDGEDVSTPDLVRRIGSALGRPVRMLPAPVGLLSLLARMQVPRVGHAAARLLGSLAVDSSALRARVGPLPFTLEAGLRETARWYQARGAS